MKKFGIQIRPPIRIPFVAPVVQPELAKPESEVVVAISQTEPEPVATIPESEPVVTTTETEAVVTTHECPTCNKLFAILNSSLKPPM